MTKPSQRKKPSGIAVSKHKSLKVAKQKALKLGPKFATLSVKYGPFKGPWVIRR